MKMTIGVFGRSRKENEFRVPVFPEHLSRFPESLRRLMVFEEGYGTRFGYQDSYFTGLGAKVAGRERLLEDCSVIMLPKPMPADLAMMKPGQVLFGWAHCVQQTAMAQLAIDRRLTVIAWESMHAWSGSGEKLLHIFYKNNELAGYAAVLHCLQLLGMDGHYGPRRKVVVLSYGSVSRGAVQALHGRGFNNIHVFTRRPAHLVAAQDPDVYYGHYFYGPDRKLMVTDSEGAERPLLNELATADIICNGILQDVSDPVLFISRDETARLKPRCVIVDVSCDLGMGFPFARPTSFTDPIIRIDPNIVYYAVDHVPSYLWNAASREISKSLLPYLGAVAEGEASWRADPTIWKAVEIQDGVVLNKDILTFQRRKPEYPHEPRS